MNKGGLSWKRLVGITKVKQRLSREMGIPLTKSGRQRKIGKAAGGCYIATCAYGSYDCEKVIALRKYRDDVLERKWIGRLFVYIYYKVSPTIVRLFGKSQLFNKITRSILDRLIWHIRNKQ